MKKVNQLIIILIVVLFPTFSQGQVVFKLKEFAEVKEKEQYSFDSFDKDNYYFSSSKEKKDYKAYNRETLLQSRTDNLVRLKFSSHYDKAENLATVPLENHVNVLSRFFNEKDNKTYYFRESFNKETGESNKDLKMVVEFDSDKSRESIPTIRYSLDSSTVAIFNQDITRKKIIGNYLIIFDHNLNVVYKKNNVYSKIREQIVNFSDFFVENSGRVHLLIQAFPSKKAFNESVVVKTPSKAGVKARTFHHMQNYTYYVISAEASKSIATRSLNAESGKFLKYASLFAVDSMCFISGIYSKSNNLNNAGVFVRSIENLSGKSIDIDEYFEFSDEFQRKYLSKKDLKIYVKAKKKGPRKLWDYHDFSNHSTLRYKGGYIILIEERLRYTANTGQKTYTAYRGDYVFGVFVDKNIKIKEVFKIPKKQESGHDDNCQSIATVYKDKLFFVFVDVVLEKRGAKQLIALELSPDFSIRKEYTIPFRKRQYIPLVPYVRISDNEFLLKTNSSNISYGKIHYAKLKIDVD